MSKRFGRSPEFASVRESPEALELDRINALAASIAASEPQPTVEGAEEELHEGEIEVVEEEFPGTTDHVDEPWGEVEVVADEPFGELEEPSVPDLDGEVYLPHSSANTGASVDFEVELEELRASEETGPLRRNPPAGSKASQHVP